MEEKLLLIEQAQAGDKNARDQVISGNLGLVWSIVRRFTGRGYEADDLFQLGCIGLIKAIDRFDSGFGVQFSTYAVPMITGEIKRFLRDDGMVKVSRSMKELAILARRKTEEFQKKEGRDPTIEELASAVGVEREELSAALESAAEVESLQQVIYQGDGGAITRMDRLEQEQDEQETLINRMTVYQLIAGLEDREQKLIVMRFFLDKTQTQVAMVLGMSQVQVSRMEKRILKKMRERMV
ncbi:MAG: SigF/SigG family RNA polymerase sporulation sigma factor [Lachnospiraceae bacterium]|nr:SigF/SigG family RNA polymerase sporulation sigma factor [Lachnospiraceae bacterium]